MRTPAFGNGEITLSAIQSVVTQAELARRLGAARVPRRLRVGSLRRGVGRGRARSPALRRTGWRARSANGTVGAGPMRAALIGAGPHARSRSTPRSRSGPSGTVDRRRPRRSVLARPEAGASFECSARQRGQLLGMHLAESSTADLPDGEHTFTVLRPATLGWELWTTPETRTWTVDTSRAGYNDHGWPRSGLDQQQQRPRSSAFTSTSCWRDVSSAASTSVTSRSCTSPKSYSDLAVGPAHVLGARNVMPWATVDSTTPATRTWTVDIISPDTMITGGPR